MNSSNDSLSAARAAALPSFSKFLHDWQALGAPDSFCTSHELMTTRGHVVACCNFFPIDAASLPAEVVAVWPEGRPAYAGPVWGRDGHKLTVVFPGIHGGGQAVYTVAEFNGFGRLVELRDYRTGPGFPVAIAKPAVRSYWSDRGTVDCNFTEADFARALVYWESLTVADREQLFASYVRKGREALARSNGPGSILMSPRLYWAHSAAVSAMEKFFDC